MPLNVKIENLKLIIEQYCVFNNKNIQEQLASGRNELPSAPLLSELKSLSSSEADFLAPSEDNFMPREKDFSLFSEKDFRRYCLEHFSSSSEEEFSASSKRKLVSSSEDEFSSSSEDEFSSLNKEDFFDNLEDGPSFEKYGGYNGYSDDAIDSAFEGDPMNTWNAD